MGLRSSERSAEEHRLALIHPEHHCFQNQANRWEHLWEESCCLQHAAELPRSAEQVVEMRSAAEPDPEPELGMVEKNLHHLAHCSEGQGLLPVAEKD